MIVPPRQFWVGGGIGLVALLLIVGAAQVQRLTRFDDVVVLPNRMVLQREFNWTLAGRDDLFAADGRARLARDVDMVCFDDRCVYVWSFERDFTGLYDAETDGMVDAAKEAVAVASSSLTLPGTGCNGYYSGWVGPDLMYDGARVPHAPPCDWRNFGKTAMLHRDWLDRPCTPDDWPARRD